MAGTIKAGQAYVELRLDMRRMSKQANTVGRVLAGRLRDGFGGGRGRGKGGLVGTLGVNETANRFRDWQRKLGGSLRGITQKTQELSNSLAKTAFLFAGTGILAQRFSRDIIGSFTPAILKASEFEETLSRFDLVFRDQADAVSAWATSFVQAIGRTEVQAKSLLSQFQNFFVGLGFGRSPAAELSKSLTELTFDLSSFFDITEDQAGRRLFQGLAGSTEALDLFGINARKAAIDAELLREQIDPRTATQSQRVLARYNVILAATSDAQGDAARTATSFANSVRRMQSYIEDMQVSLGKQLNKELKTFVGLGATAARTFRDWSQAQDGLASKIIGLVSGLSALSTGLIAVGAITGLLASALAVLTPVVASIAVLFKSLGSALTAGIVAGPLLVAYFTDFKKIAEAIVPIFRDLIKELENFTRVALASGEFLAAGDWETAFQTMTLELEIIWEQFLANLVTASFEVGKEITRAIVRGVGPAFIGPGVQLLPEEFVFGGADDKYGDRISKEIDALRGYQSEIKRTASNLNDLLKINEQIEKLEASRDESGLEQLKTIRESRIIQTDMMRATRERAELTKAQAVELAKFERAQLSSSSGGAFSEFRQTGVLDFGKFGRAFGASLSAPFRELSEAVQSRDRVPQGTSGAVLRLGGGQDIPLDVQPSSVKIDPRILSDPYRQQIGRQGREEAITRESFNLFRGFISTFNRESSTKPGEQFGKRYVRALITGLGAYAVAPQQLIAQGATALGEGIPGAVDFLRSAGLQQRLAQLDEPLAAVTAFSAAAAVAGTGTLSNVPNRQRDEIIAKLDQIEANTRSRRQGSSL